MAAITMPDHIRDIDMFVVRYGLKPYGPIFFFPNQVPNTQTTPIFADTEIQSSTLKLYDVRGRAETPIYLPQFKTVVSCDALTERNGELRVGFSP